MNIRDTLERLVWTVAAAFLGGLVASGIDWPVGIDALDAAKLAALTAGVNFLSIVARKRLAQLPDPGEGLGVVVDGEVKGLPVE